MLRSSLNFVVTLCVLLPSVASAGGDWPMYQADAQHSGYVAQRWAPRTAAPLWTARAQAGAPSGLSVADGRVFTTPVVIFGSSTAPLVAQNLADGHALWSFDFGSSYSVSQPAIDHGVLYLQTSQNRTYVYAINAADGSPVWRTELRPSQFFHELSPIVVDQTLYFAADSELYKLDTAAGGEYWYRGLSQRQPWSPTWANGIVVAYTERLQLIAPDTGVVFNSIVDREASPYSEPNQSAVIVGNFAYATNSGRLQAFDMVNGSVAWSLAIDASGQVSTDGKQVFVVAGGALTARDPASGNLLWSWTPPSAPLTSNLIVSDSHVIAGSAIATYAIGRATHQLEQTFDATGLLAIGGGDTLVVADSLGIVHAYSLPHDDIFGGNFE